MPKLSRYIESEKETRESCIVFIEGNKPDTGEKIGQHVEKGSNSKLRRTTVKSSTSKKSDSRLADTMAKRVLEYGERQYRWSDGTMRSSKPPRSPYAVSTRKSWGPLVRYCREHGGDREFARSRRSARYGIDVSYEDHLECLQGLDLSPEVDRNGNFVELDPNKLHPLKDPEHAFNTYYSKEAKNLFR